MRLSELVVQAHVDYTKAERETAVTISTIEDIASKYTDDLAPRALLKMTLDQLDAMGHRSADGVGSPLEGLRVNAYRVIFEALLVRLENKDRPGVEL